MNCEHCGADHLDGQPDHYDQIYKCLTYSINGSPLKRGSLCYERELAQKQKYLDATLEVNKVLYRTINRLERELEQKDADIDALKSWRETDIADRKRLKAENANFRRHLRHVRDVIGSAFESDSGYACKEVWDYLKPLTLDEPEKEQ